MVTVLWKTAGERVLAAIEKALINQVQMHAEYCGGHLPEIR